MMELENPHGSSACDFFSPWESDRRRSLISENAADLRVGPGKGGKGGKGVQLYRLIWGFPRPWLLGIPPFLGNHQYSMLTNWLGYP